jgi:hypothetical protein
MDAKSAFNVANTIADSERDGWLLGYAGMPWPGPWPKLRGDLIVMDPGGWPAGVAWESSGPAIQQLAGPTQERWGVFRVLFPMPVMSAKDLIANFHLALPLLKEERAKVGSR